MKVVYGILAIGAFFAALWSFFYGMYQIGLLFVIIELILANNAKTEK